jgi:REP element-mobilizing transposase RayT
VFFTPADRSLFYDLLCEGVIRFGYRVHAFCLMTNHVHLALQAGEAPPGAPGQARQLSQARTLIAWLAVQTQAATLEEIARRFNRSASTLSQLVTRLEKHSLTSPETMETLQKHLNTVMQA